MRCCTAALPPPCAIKGCGAGQFTNETKQTACEDCDVGFYDEGKGHTDCAVRGRTHARALFSRVVYEVHAPARRFAQPTEARSLPQRPLLTRSAGLSFVLLALPGRLRADPTRPDRVPPVCPRMVLCHRRRKPLHCVCGRRVQCEGGVDRVCRLPGGKLLRDERVRLRCLCSRVVCRRVAAECL